MENRFEGKVVLVTGGTSGIGLTTAIAFAQEGATVVITGRRTEEGEQAVALISETGSEAFFIRSDMSIAKDVESCIQQLMARYNRLDCLFNNAGIAGPVQSLLDVEEETWDTIMNVNLKGVWLTMKYAIPAMLASEPKGGTIVNMSSVLGLTGVNTMGSAISPYMASKHGVVGLTKSAALEFISQNVRINAVCPAYIRTPMFDKVLRGNPELDQILRSFHPIGRFGTPEEVAESVLWLCSDKSTFMVGCALPVDGGYMAK